MTVLKTKISSNRDSPQNENFNLLVRIKSLNLFLYSFIKKKLKYLLVQTSFTGLEPEDRCSPWGLWGDIFWKNENRCQWNSVIYLKRVLFTYKNRIPKLVTFCESRKTILLNNYFFIYQYSKFTTVKSID